MVQFNKSERKFTIIMDGDESDYMYYLRALARLLAIQHPDFIDRDTLYFGGELLASMLPSDEQNVKVE